LSKYETQITKIYTAFAKNLHDEENFERVGDLFVLGKEIGKRRRCEIQKIEFSICLTGLHVNKSFLFLP
jgi:hypothetical protein